MKIAWQSKSPLVYTCFEEGRIDSTLNGGNVYDLQAMFALRKHFNVEMDAFALRHSSDTLLKYLFRLRKGRSDADLLIMEPYPVVFGRRKKGQRSIAMIHHIDPVSRVKSGFHRYYFNRLLKELQKVDKVVAVSVYWKKFLEREGCENVDVIYNSFDLSLYRNFPKSNPDFLNKHNLPNDKKIIYIGNAMREKGVYEVYDALKDSGYHLVMSGAKNRAADLPVHYLRLDKNDYLQLLAVSSVVMAMSKMEEGWNRIAHESLLLKTPVIGSGSGGMAELLDKSGQLRLTDLSDMKEAVHRVITNGSDLAAKGFEYVRQFDLNYFERRWVEVVNSVMEK